MDIAILGCGPAGLVAAHAAMQMKINKRVQIYSHRQRSPIYGAQYLHQPIPGTFVARGGEPEIVRYSMVGTPESYLRKVYGDAWDGHISDDLRDQAHVAWDMRSTYDELWFRYEDAIVDYPILKDPVGISAAINPIIANHDLVINTIPRPALCLRGHNFKSADIWALGEVEGREFPIECANNIITYNGDSSPGWYRASRIHGYSTVEWPGYLKKPPLPGVARARKPLNHNCDCWLGSIIHLGRMGRWQHGYLVHNVYADMMEQLLIKGAEMEIAG